ncbi:AAA family ATPase [Caldicoprobacter algeriensis]|uniref:AAA family ATPase n=1 Tax=Caldicoprobacter algeriensis TaxID=699281 RepID=UPI00207A4696|nr:AAA family ATPase [Caldicoprobacter algeriensis]MCM8901274.1 AAA family ATPase [Caldicoprobacter algeriensis]
MRFQKLKAQAFGCLKDWESPLLKPGLILVFGRNESGKSTLFNLITTLFYGWYPANRDANPYVPWGESEAACEGELLIEEGEVVTVSRRLRNTPIGMLIRADRVTELRNRTLPYVEVLPREVFREVYAVELSNLKFPQQRAWETMQQLLLGGQFGSFLRPISQVAGELEEEANRLWRPDRRGKPRAREIGERLRELRTLLEEARAREERLRQAQVKLAERQRVLEENIAKKSRLIAYIDRCERLNPVRKKLKRIQELKEVSAYAANYDDLPEDPAGHLKNIDAQLEELKFQRVKLEGKKRQLEGVVQAFTERDQVLLNHAGEIKLLIKSYDRIRADQQELKNLEFDIKSKGEQLKHHASEVLVGGWRPELAKALDAVDTAVLKVAIDSFRQVQEHYQEQENRVEALKISARQKRGVGFIPWFSGAFSILGMLGFILAHAPEVKFLSALVMVTGIILLLTWWLFGRRSIEHIGLKLEEKRLQQLYERVEEGRARIKMLLNGVPVVPQRLGSPDSTLLLDIGKLKELLQYIKESLDRKEVIVERIIQSERRALKLLGECGLDENWVGSNFGSFYDNRNDDGHPDASILPNSGNNDSSAGAFAGVYNDVAQGGYRQAINGAKQSDVLGMIDLLQVMLQEAERRYQDAQNAKGQLEDLKLELSKVDETIAQLEREKGYILSRLNELPGEDMDAKVEGLMKARELARQADSILEDLRRDYPDLEDIERQIMELTQRDEEWSFDDDTLARAKAERDQIEQELNVLNNEIGTLKKEIEIGMGQGNMDEIEGEITLLEAELKRIARQRDRLLLMRNVILEAERRFREEHQPDVLKKAGKYLSAITDGRYTRLFTKEDQQAALLVKCVDSQELIEVKEGFLSRGTLEQVYLSLRLAFMEHLDPGGNLLPAFLDEVFVNWDGFRLDNGLGLLKELVKQRQVFIFTCHDWLVERLAGKLDVQVVELRM